MSDVRMQAGFWDHPKTVKLRRRLGLEGVIAFVQLWHFCDENAGLNDGGRHLGHLDGMSDEDIEIASKLDCDPGALVAALVDVRFLDGEPGAYRIHEFPKHQPFVASKPQRILSSLRANAIRWHGRHAVPDQSCPKCYPELDGTMAVTVHELEWAESAPDSDSESDPDSAPDSDSDPPRSPTRTPDYSAAESPLPSMPSKIDRSIEAPDGASREALRGVVGTSIADGLHADQLAEVVGQPRDLLLEARRRAKGPKVDNPVACFLDQVRRLKAQAPQPGSEHAAAIERERKAPKSISSRAPPPPPSGEELETTEYGLEVARSTARALGAT